MELRDLDMEPPVGERAGRRFGGGSGLDSQNKQLILKAAGLLLLFILLILFLFFQEREKVCIYGRY